MEDSAKNMVIIILLFFLVVITGYMTYDKLINKEQVVIKEDDSSTQVSCPIIDSVNNCDDSQISYKTIIMNDSTKSMFDVLQENNLNYNHQNELALIFDFGKVANMDLKIRVLDKQDAESNGHFQKIDIIINSREYEFYSGNISEDYNPLEIFLKKVKLLDYKDTILLIQDGNLYSGSDLESGNIQRYTENGLLFKTERIFTNYFNGSEMMECSIEVTGDGIVYCQYEGLEITNEMQSVNKVLYRDDWNVEVLETFEAQLHQQLG